MMPGVPVRFELALMGELFEPRAGTIVLDVGSRCVPGVIDHHFAGAGEECAASLVFHRPELVLDHLGSESLRELVIVVHRMPDLDCTVASWLVMQLVATGAFPDGSRALAHYARMIDAGQPPPDGLGERSLWALYTASTLLLGTAAGDQDEGHVRWIRRGHELVDAALEGFRSSESGPWVPAELAGWERERALLREQRELYVHDRTSARVYSIVLPGLNNELHDVRGMTAVAPKSALFKHLARAEGFVFTHVIHPDHASRLAGVQTARHILSVATERGVWLRGLGAALEGREVLARAEAGASRSGPPRWPDVTNSDPWYDGRSPLHGYTIVDTPRQGTILGTVEVEGIVHEPSKWIPLGEPRKARACPSGCWIPEDPEARFCPRHGAQLVPAVIDGRYEVISFIGQGGMGVVYEVEDRHSLRRYALKMLRHDLLASQDAWKLFVREARLANRIGHRNVVRMFDFGADPAAGLYSVSEYVRGVTLEEDIQSFSRQSQPYPWSRIQSVMMQLCDALQAVHGVGVLHRDLKPQNVMLMEAGPPDDLALKVLDFGIAILSDPSATRLTRPGVVHASVHYAAPEQLLDEPMDVRTDLYSAGAIMYEMLSGIAPFASTTNLAALMYAKCFEPPPRLSAKHPMMLATPAIGPFLARLLDRDKDRRFASAGEVQQAFSTLVG